MLQATYDLSEERLNAELTIARLLHLLTERQRTVIELRFGLKDGRARTLEEVAAVFDVTRERIRQIESGALQVLREAANTKPQVEGE